MPSLFSSELPRFLIGQAGQDQLIGSQRDEVVIGLSGGDLLVARGGNDSMFGGPGSDRLFGNAGNDYMRGGLGDDELFGGNGNDTVSGGRGDDTVTGGRGNDILRGGEGHDDFVFDPSRAGEGIDKVRDFALGEDKIVLDVNAVLASTPSLAGFIVDNGGTVEAVLAGLDDAPEWSLGSDARGNLEITHPTGTIILQGVPSGATSFAEIAPALSVTGLGEVLASLAETTGQPASVAELVGASGGVADDNPDDFDLLGISLATTGLTDVLADEDASFSVFAPTDAAFVSLAERLGFSGEDEGLALDYILSTLTVLGEGDPIPLLTDILTYHVAEEARTLGELQNDKTISPLFEDADLAINGEIVEDQDPDFDDAMISAADIVTGNGIVQVVNEVLLPFDL